MFIIVYSSLMSLNIFFNSMTCGFGLLLRKNSQHEERMVRNGDEQISLYLTFSTRLSILMI